jgi:hypothetical protein
MYIQYVPTVALLFHTQQYPPYLYRVYTGSCCAVPHAAVPTISIYITYRPLHFSLTTAVPTISIYSTYRPLHCSFTHSSTHHIYIQYVLTFALFFQTQQYLPYLYTLRTDRYTDLSHTAVHTISIYITYRRLHCSFTHSITPHIYIQYVPTVALLFHTLQYPPYLYTLRTDGCTALSHTAVPTISIYSTFRPLHCSFTRSNTHHIYIEYIPAVAVLFHTQQYPVYLYKILTEMINIIQRTAVVTF